MYVGQRMLKGDEFVTIDLDTLVMDAEKIMVEHRLWMLLVVKDGKLVGCVKKEDVLEALPSRATTLSKHELNYLLAKLKVEKILKKSVPTIGPEAEIEEAAQAMFKDDLPGLAVVDSGNRLLGYINRNVMLGVLVEEMGLEHGGSRIAFETEDRTGVMHEVSGLMADMGISIISTGTFFRNGRRMLVFRVKTDDTAPLEKALQGLGYKIVGPGDYA